MLERLPGWSSELCRSGLFLVPPDPRQGTLFYAERLRPLATIQAILRSVELQFPSPHPCRVVAIDPQLTDEGEHAVIATLADRLGPARTVGVIYGDDYYALCVALPATPAHAAMFEQLVRRGVARDRHALGVRRRRFVYVPPPGWQGNLTPPFHAAWYPLDFPGNRSCLLIDPATPVAPGLALKPWMIDSVASAADGKLSDTATRELSTPAGLSGMALRATVDAVSGAKLVYDYVVLQDDRYLYPVLLQSPFDKRDENGATLQAVVGSIQPIPRLRSQRDFSGGVFSWMTS